MPRTLVVATVLLYAGAATAAVLAVLGRSFPDLVAAALLLSAAYLTANARSIGWLLGTAVSLIQLAAPFAAVGANSADNLRPGLLLTAMLPAATFAALVVPASRDFRRVWFT